MYNDYQKIGFFAKFIGFLSFVWMLIWLGIICSIFYLLYTIITKPELLAHWIKVVFG